MAKIYTRLVSKSSQENEINDVNLIDGIHRTKKLFLCKIWKIRLVIFSSQEPLTVRKTSAVQVSCFVKLARTYLV